MPFFEQNIKVGLVCLNAQMKKIQIQNTAAEREKSPPGRASQKQ